MQAALVRGHRSLWQHSGCDPVPAGGQARAATVRGSCTVARTALVGIDLGTSNCTVACLEDGHAVVVPAADGRRSTPSVISLAKDGAEEFVGTAALQRAGSSEVDTYRSVKRLIGRSFTEACGLSERATPPALRQSARGQAALWSSARQALLSPEEIFAVLLRHLVSQAAQYLGRAVDGAVITVPADFTDIQRRAIRAAAQIAGLDSVQLLQEPVAAALAYGAGDSGRDENVLVFDLGGGTLDVSLLDSFEGALEVLETDGDGHLGGNDFDQALVDWLLPRHMLNEQAAAIRANSTAWARLLCEAEAVKVALSGRATAHVQLMVPGAPVTRVRLSQDDLQEATWHLRPRLWAPLARMGQRACVQWRMRPAGTEPLEAAPLLPGQLLHLRRRPSPPPARDYTPPPRLISRVVLVGGSSRIPWVRQLVLDATGVAPSRGVDPEECVAVGAALYAGMLSGHVQGIELADGAYAQDLHGRASGFPTA